MKKIYIKNRYGDVKCISLVDDDDYEKYGHINWHATGDGYAARNAAIENGKQKKIYLHRIISSAPSGMVVDHKNHDKLDNRKVNLIICTQKENIQNINPNKNLGKLPSSGYRNIIWDKRIKKWVVRIQRKLKRFYLGEFVNLDDAIKIADSFKEKNPIGDKIDSPIGLISSP